MEKLITVTLYKKDSGKWYGECSFLVDYVNNLPSRTVCIAEVLKHYTSADFVLHVTNGDFSTLYL